MALGRPNVDDLNAEVRAWAMWLVDRFELDTGVRPVITSGFRSRSDQEQLYANRASNPYPVNRPGDSAHEYGMGWDSYVPPEWQEWWNYYRRYVGFRVPENDHVHADVPGWRDIVGIAQSSGIARYASFAGVGYTDPLEDGE